MKMKGNDSSTLAAGAVIVLAAILSYSPLLFGGGWFSDDYMQVYGLHGEALPSFEESIREAGTGSISVARTFSRVQMGHGGAWLGEFRAMVVRVAGHALNAFLLFLLLRRLTATRPVALGAALIFATAPWHTQAVVWWATVHLGFAITLLLLALLAYQSWLAHGAWWRLMLTQVLVFASLMTYEQGLASWLVFFGVALLQTTQPEDFNARRWGPGLRRVFTISWPMLIPFALWAFLYLVTFPLESHVRTPKVSLDRNLIALASTHLRWFDTLYRMPWADLWRQGIASITLLAAALTGLLAIAAAWMLGWRRAQEAAARMDSVRLILSLVFAYLLFAGFRLVFVMQGATSTETRNSYGANMGVALAIAAVAYFVLVGRLHRPVLYALTLTVFCLANMLATRGEAWHVARNVQDERIVFEKAVASLAGDPQADSLAVVVTKPLTNGEKDFYEEFDGGWLEYRLEKKLGRKIDVQIGRDGVTPSGATATVVTLP